MARSTKEEALETRNRLLDAAEDVFHAHGVARTSLADVAQAANLTRGAVYWHFKNKSDLFNAMCERVRLPMEEMAAASADEREEDPLGQLRATCIFCLRETVHNPHSRKVFGILFHKCEFVDTADPVLLRQQESSRQARERLQRILANAVARGQLPSDLDIPLASLAFQASIEGLLNNWLFSPDGFDLANNLERLVDGCIDMLRYATSFRKRPTSR